jgi:hypothetical protein
VIGRYAYVDDGATGVVVIDVQTPTAPTLIGTANTPGNAANLTTNGRYLYVADGSGGLRIFDTQGSAECANARDSYHRVATTTATGPWLNRLAGPLKKLPFKMRVCLSSTCRL